MATLLLTSRSAPGATDRMMDSPSLRAWLRKDWAILFSHPEDFVRCELEMDRWLAVVQRAFAGFRIRPLALASAVIEEQNSWIAQVSGDTRMVLLEDPSHESARAFDLRARALRNDIAALGQNRFVMIIDDALCSRRTFAYTRLAGVPPPLEFLGWADAARTRHTMGDAVEKQSAAAKARAPHISAMRHHKHRPQGEACNPPTRAHAAGGLGLSRR